MIAAGICVASLLLIVWVLAGYPLVLRWRAQWHPQPFQRDSKLRFVSVVIAVRNGERYLRHKLDSLLAQDYPQEQMEIILISDGSTDGTDQIAKEYASRGVRLLRQGPSGKPAALNLGVPLTKGELLLLTDVRQVLAPDTVRKLVACFGDERVGVASGELKIRAAAHSGEASIGLYWRYESAIRSWLSTVDSMLGATGPIYAIRRSLFEKLPPEILLDDMYLPLLAFLKGYRLVQEQQAVAYDYPTMIETEFRRKVRTLAGNYQLLRYLPALLNPFRNRLWSDYVSYKLGRLVLPFALLAVLCSSIFLPGPWLLILLAGQAGFYALAAADLFWPATAVGKRYLSSARAFVVLMAASVCALSVFFVPPQRLWKVTQTAIR